MNVSVQRGSGIEQYKKAGTQTSLETASPHRLIQMLLEGALEKLRSAKLYMQSGDRALKGSHISWAISILDGLRMSIDKEAGGEIGRNLDDLYEYMARRLIEANAQNDLDALDEVSALLIEIKSAWDAVPDAMQAQQETFS
ncbi:flagellar protein FliS [Candidatus Tenderia electrophaga]|jgi:flagellar protein FliS|uniref:Flagellar secretion chaperone FliS n=1 Tax=Candidatus Tenderia electrophaga TaxID=1748243 RepID=A0A0S2TC00_9GAMM|nr:flagellar protein FliS [Candidatus Tenderia electrophaga]